MMDETLEQVRKNLLQRLADGLQHEFERRLEEDPIGTPKELIDRARAIIRRSGVSMTHAKPRKNPYALWYYGENRASTAWCEEKPDTDYDFTDNPYM